MRTKNFLVPLELIEVFSDVIKKHSLDNCIVGITRDREIEISIDYDTNQKKLINEMQDFLDKHNYDEDDEEDED